MNNFKLQKRLLALHGQIDQAAYHLNRARQLEADGSFVDYGELTYEAVRLLEKATCGARELVIDTGFARHSWLMEEIAELHGISVEDTGNWYKIVIPTLLPSKRREDPCTFITAPLRFALERFTRETMPRRLRAAIICFRHIYGADLPERTYRDHDNIEVKKVQDIVADKLLVDDTGILCSSFQTSLKGSASATEVYILPVEMLSKWLESYPVH